MVSIVLAALCWLVLRRRIGSEPRRLGNGLLVLGIGWFGASAVLEIGAATIPGVGFVWLFALALLPLSVVALALALLGNGLVMVRREGRSLGNLLSALAGLALLAMPVLGTVLLLSLTPAGVAAAVLLGAIAAYLGVFFLTALTWAFAYARLRPRRRPVAVVALGSGLIDGRVPPLLRGRLDRAVEAWRHAPGAVLVASGGQGDDEPRPEAEAMAEHLRARGVPDEAIVVEDRSTTTRENLEFSTAALAARGIAGDILVVTSDYHALRASLLARQLGVPGQAIGARTARYFVPSAFLREFAALLTEHRRLGLAAAIAAVLLAAGAFAVVSAAGA